MRAFHQGADVREVVRFECLNRLGRTGDFSDDMPGTSENTVVHFLLCSVNIFHGDIPPTFFPCEGKPIFRFLTAGAVASVGEVVRNVGIGDDDGKGRV